jgi:pimeloyl-ACP methyl ester carboxylesterase
MHFFARSGLTFHYHDLGQGLPFVFQHGLGGDLNQPRGLYQPAAGVRLLAMDMRAHGRTTPLGDVEQLAIATLASDLAALFDHVAISQAVVGGISLGAAVAIKLALQSPERIKGLILVRPAWIDRALPANVERYATIARSIREFGPGEGLDRFRATPEFQAVSRESPDCASSLMGQFQEPRAAEYVARLERLAADRLCSDRSGYRALRIPTLILGNRQDPIHPWPLAEELATLIAGAKLVEVTPKSVSLDRHRADVALAIDNFLTHHFLQP